MQILYIDTLFLINIIMNLIIFKVATTITKGRVTINQLSIAALLSTIIYCIGIIVPIFRQIPAGIYQVFVPIVSIMYLFKCGSIRDFLKKMMIVNGVAWVIGGVGFNIYYIVGNYATQMDVSIIVPIGAGMVIMVFVELGYKMIRQSFIEPNYTYDVTFQVEDGKKEIVAYLDTGNMLYTINHDPVMLVEYAEVVDFVSKEYRELLDECKEEIVLEQLMKYQKDIKIYLIPFTSVGCKNSILLGIPIKNIILSKGAYREVKENIVVGICYHSLFKDRRYQALIHPDLISNHKGEVKNEVKRKGFIMDS